MEDFSLSAKATKDIQTKDPDPNQELKCTYSSVVVKDNKPMISILFERGSDTAEGVIPACDITKSAGFSREEVEALENYMKEHKKEFIDNAKKISRLDYLMR